MGRAGRIVIGPALVALALMVWAGVATATTIKGHVTDEGGGPIAGIAVCADAPEFVYPGGCVWTGADGSYAIEGLVAGGYQVGFRVENPTQNYAPQWYDGKAHREEAELVAREGGTAEGIDAVMQVGGEIVGTVTDRQTGQPIEGVEVCARLAGFSHEFVSCDRTEAAGGYVVKDLGTDQYTVEFNGFLGSTRSPNYIPESYPGNVSVTAGQVTAGIDAHLAGGVRIEGHVVDAATGRAPEHPVPAYGTAVTIPSVCALDPATERRVGCASIEEDGSYAISGLPLGTYVISFALDPIAEGIDYAPDGFVRRYWREVQNFGEATPVGSMTSAVIGGIAAAISRGEEIMPTVPPLVVHPPLLQPPPPRPAPRPKLHCKKGFRKVTKRRHTRCVKARKGKAGHHRHRKPARRG